MNQKTFLRFLPALAALLTIAYFGYAMRPQHSPAGDFDYHGYGQLLVIDRGRPKPLETVARTNLMVITHRQTYYDYDTGKYYPATKWLLDVETTPPPQAGMFANLFKNGADSLPAWDHKVFRIENDELLDNLKLKMRDGLRYSINEIRAKGGIDWLVHEAERVRGMNPKKYKLLDAKVMELWTHLNLYIRLSSHTLPLTIPDPQGGDQWKAFGAVADEVQDRGGLVGNGIDTQTFKVYAKMLMAYDEGGDEGKATFNSLVKSQLETQAKEWPDKVKAANLEVFFNEFSPFYHCLLTYILVALLGSLSWLATTWSEPLRRTAYAMMGVAFAFHLTGLVIRMILQDRLFVFVTNLYSSAVFIGLGCVAICLIAEHFYKNGIAIVVGSVTAFLTLIIAHLLSLSGDTMEMMQAVLDTNFWLATHVTCVTLGYTTAVVAGFMGIAYIFLGVFTDKLRKNGSADLARMTYGVLCTGMFLSFVGTVLGGLWADYSWGRFWGWDPKENGALLIVLWIAMILHARWGGMVKHRGIAVLSVLGVIVTGWSWFGTNFLGLGLHAYGGFKGDAMLTLVGIDCVFLSIAGLGMMPLRMWQSFRPQTPEGPTTPLSAPPKTAIRVKPA